MHIDDLLASAPPVLPVPAAEVAAAIDPALVHVVLDDDPTGTQSVADLPVLTSWEPADLDWALATGAPAVYVLTNSRSLSPEDAAARGREVARGALASAERTGRRVAFVSRSDSTLRGHFPLETDVLVDALVEAGQPAPALTVLVPAFPEAGRITVDAVHHWVVDGEATPVGETPFAADSTFGFRSSDLRDWVEEKTGGAVSRGAVASLPLSVVRSGAATIEARLRTLPVGTVVVPDVVVEDDMRQVALALHALERDGIGSLLRVGPPYVRAHIGQEPSAPVTSDRIRFASDRGGLVVVGSHVPLTTAQLAGLRERHPETTTIELDVHALLGDERSAHLDERVAAVVGAIDGGTVIVHTTRTLVEGADGDESLEIARRVSSAVVEVVQRVLEAAPPRFVVAKGGITSSDVATHGLGTDRAMAVGPMLPGIVSLWQPQSGPALGIPCVVFAGNVGAPASLADVVDTLSA